MELKLIYGPKVYLIASQAIESDNYARFLDDQGTGWRSTSGVAGEVLAETAGRLCYQSWYNPRPGGNATYLAHVLEVGHGSVLEHAVFTMIFTGISRSTSHELVRHRVGFAYSQLSQRYVDSSDIAFVVPPALAPAVKAYNAKGLRVVIGEKEQVGWVWCIGCKEDLFAYRQATSYLQEQAPTELTGTEKRKWARQAARSVLPNCVETKICVTGNARAWRHFIEMRCSRHADREICILAGKVWEQLNARSPNLFGDYAKTQLPDGTYELNTPYKKV